MKEEREEQMNPTPNNAKESTMAFDGFPCTAGTKSQHLLDRSKVVIFSWKEKTSNDIYHTYQILMATKSGK